MIHWIISFIIIVLVISLLRDLRVEKWYHYWGLDKVKLIEEYDVSLPLWMVLVIVLLGIIPVVNIVLFLAFLTVYIIHALWDPQECDLVTHVFILKGNTFVGRILKRIGRILNTKI